MIRRCTNFTPAVVLLLFAEAVFGQQDMPGEKVTFLHSPEQSVVDVYMDGQHFTSYRYEDTWKKPLLYPLMTKSGYNVARGYPIEPLEGERYDHPHHVGFWLNYGDVNDLDFWNNSNQRDPEKSHRYGSVVHKDVVAMHSDGEIGKLEVTANWVNSVGDVLLYEQSSFTFREIEGIRCIDRQTTLTANVNISFGDSKEGMVAVRVAKELELPISKPIKILDNDGKPSDEPIIDTTTRHGDYLSSEGVKGKAVWGTRATWMRLSSPTAALPVCLVLMDHPDNIGYPTYWHARDYGLFAANPLGQEVFSKGRHKLNHQISKGDSVTWKYRLLIHEGDPLSPEKIGIIQQEFSGRK